MATRWTPTGLGFLPGFRSCRRWELADPLALRSLGGHPPLGHSASPPDLGSPLAFLDLCFLRQDTQAPLGPLLTALEARAQAPRSARFLSTKGHCWPPTPGPLPWFCTGRKAKTRDSEGL